MFHSDVFRCTCACFSNFIFAPKYVGLKRSERRAIAVALGLTVKDAVFLRIHTAHLDIIKVFFYSPTDAQVNCLKNNIKIYIKI